MKAKTKKFLKEFFIVLVGNLLLAFAVSFFFINYVSDYVYSFNNETKEASYITFNGILVGGTSGFSLILRNLFFLNVADSAFIIETIITITTWVLFFLGLFFLGKTFAIQTLLSTIFYPIFIFFFGLPIFDALHAEINLFSPIVCAVAGGALMGVGCGIIYKIGGSTGGFDIPPLIINKYTRIKLSILFFLTDGLLVVLAIIAKFSLYEIVIGLIAVGSYSLAVEFAQRVGQEAYICDIVTNKWEEINYDIIHVLDRSTTLVDVKGGYTLKDRKLIKTLIAKQQYLQILDIVKKHDPNAFMCVSRTHDVFGEGYTDLSQFMNK